MNKFDDKFNRYLVCLEVLMSVLTCLYVLFNVGTGMRVFCLTACVVWVVLFITSLYYMYGRGKTIIQGLDYHFRGRLTFCLTACIGVYTAGEFMSSEYADVWVRSYLPVLITVFVYGVYAWYTLIVFWNLEGGVVSGESSPMERVICIDEAVEILKPQGYILEVEEKEEKSLEDITEKKLECKEPKENTPYIVYTGRGCTTGIVQRRRIEKGVKK